MATLKKNNTDSFQWKYDNNTSERSDNTMPFKICTDNEINCFFRRRPTIGNIT